ncbi:MAR-binding filament-like protein 1-1 [Nicotiana tomentosiformis]|uniref:MAR-binding filament-like protein 1-1 n=1 Tax=Nicotiana tomentosiformis TaxID=4098 RepID=UPI00388C5739
MAKTSKTVPQEEKISSSRPTGEKIPVEPRLGDNIIIRPPPPGEEEVLKPTKDKKRRRASPPDTPKPRKSRARKSKTDPAVLSADATALHQEASSKYRDELARCEVDLKNLTEERDALKLLYVHKEEEIMSIRAELTRSHQDQTELIERVEELETRLAAALARSTSEAEALVASYRADAEAANTQAKEISDAAEVRLSRVAEHARRQSRRETLEEVHTCSFDLMAYIESAKVLEDEAGALLSDDENSASGSKNGKDKDKAPEDVAPEAD